MVFNLFPPTPLRDMIVAVVKAMPLRLFPAKSQGWGVGSVCSEKLSGRQSVEPQSVSQLDTHQLSKRPHSPSTCFKERALAAHNLGCVNSSHHTWVYGRKVVHNEGSIQGGILEICGSFYWGRLSKWLRLLLFSGWEPGGASNARTSPAQQRTVLHDFRMSNETFM